VKYRSTVVDALIRRCGASPALRSYGGVLPASR
jgi:hypothetical protein